MASTHFLQLHFAWNRQLGSASDDSQLRRPQYEKDFDLPGRLIWVRPFAGHRKRIIPLVLVLAKSKAC
jgi:hypothetical protein